MQIMMVAKSIYWSVFWVIGLGWFTPIFGGQNIFGWRQLPAYALSVAMIAAIASLRFDWFLEYLKTKKIGKPGYRYVLGGFYWATCWSVLFALSTLSHENQCTNGPYSCWNWGLIGQILILIFFVPLVAGYTALVGAVGSGFYVDIFRVKHDLK